MLQFPPEFLFPWIEIAQTTHLDKQLAVLPCSAEVEETLFTPFIID